MTGFLRFGVNIRAMPRKKVINPLFEISPIEMSTVIEYQEHEVGEAFVIALKTPKNDERFMDDHKHFTKSNINVCYAQPRTKGKSRDWFETQMSVAKSVRLQKGYPMKGMPFYAVTDDGWGFMAHTTSQNNKQFAAVGDELILGKWIKGRLADAGLVKPVQDVAKDTERLGMITSEMLESYGCNAIAFQKTDLRIEDPIVQMNSYEIWTLKMIWIEDE